MADTWDGGAGYLVTLDKAHFLEAPELAGQVLFPTGTPGDCLAWYRGKLQEMQDASTGSPA